MNLHFLRQAAPIFWLAIASSPAAADDRIDFNRDIRPVLSNSCFQCHGPDDGDRKSDLRLDIPDGDYGALTPRKEYNIIKPGAPEESELWRRISTGDADERMPPEGSHKEPLTDEQIALFAQWIKEGATYQDFWAFVPPEKSPPAKIENQTWIDNPIDRHVMGRLEQQGLNPSPEADKRTLIRRVTFDLTGLPPTLEEIEEYLNDTSSDAYTELVDRLLSRLAYGEHMARYWADLVRLSDTNGMHKDFHREFSAYRDWLIRSFNSNLPFDDFVSYQLAGDLYKNPTRDQLVASGFNRLHMIIDRGTALPEESRHKNIVDRVEAFGTTFLGLTVQCGQCHDHKYDPLTQKEYFQLYAFFNNFSGAPETVGAPARGLQPPFINLTTPEQDQVLADFDTSENALKTELAAIKQRKESSDDSTTSPETTPENEDNSHADAAEQLTEKLKRLNKEKANFLRTVPAAMIMREKDPPIQATILVGGAYDAPGEPVERNTPAFLPPLKTREGIYTRLDLAEWLVARNHPLTARVAVNRFWQQFFGVGLVKTSEDFGAQGEWPSHPELLDELAVSFMESGWNVKTLVRQIVLSKTYRQSSDAKPEAFVEDPENRNLARGSRYRMDAEMIRDQILAVSGQLNQTMYGKSVKPPQPPGLWEMVSMAAPLTYIADTDEKIYRRSFYTYWRRGIPPPQMTIMNAPSREFCLTRRERTNTPLQALLLMNEQEYFRAAKATAKRTLKETQDVEAGLSLIYEKITSHEPSANRLALMEATLYEFKDLYQNDPALMESLSPELTNHDVDERVELAAWTMMTHSLFNLELTKVRR